MTADGEQFGNLEFKTAARGKKLPRDMQRGHVKCLVRELP